MGVGYFGWVGGSGGVCAVEKVYGRGVGSNVSCLPSAAILEVEREAGARRYAREGSLVVLVLDFRHFYCLDWMSQLPWIGGLALFFAFRMSCLFWFLFSEEFVLVSSM